MRNVKEIEKLFNSKQYDLVKKYAKDSTDPKARLYLLSTLMIEGKDVEAILEIKEHNDLYMKSYPAKVIKAHFELLLKNKLYKDASEALLRYQNMPYISQEVEELFIDVKKELDSSHNSSKHKKDLDEILDILETSNSDKDISGVLFTLNEYNFDSYKDSLLHVLNNKNIHPNLRCYALIIMVEHKLNKEVKYLSKDKELTINPSKLNPPFGGYEFKEVMISIEEKSDSNTSLSEVAMQLYNYYIMDTYPNDIYVDELDDIASALIELAKSYLNITQNKMSEKVESLYKRIKETIDSTKPLEI